MLRVASNMALVELVQLVLVGTVLQELVGKTMALCDPLTQYELNGECCKKCGPGTKMLDHSTCTAPQCEECGDYYYQDKYTIESECQQQPFCSPNKNQQASKPESKKERRPCICLLGFHCSSVACVTCVQHTNCKPGQWAKFRGNQTHDTVCESCPEGTFSASHSRNSVCTNWTECESGFHLQEVGTSISDNVCEKTLRHHGGLIAVFAVVGSLLILFGLAYCLCRGEAHQRAKDYLDSCRGGHEKLPMEPTPPMFIPVKETESEELRLTAEEEEEEKKMPEENQEELRDVQQVDAVLSDNGQCVTQERGKDVIQPQQETQVHVCTDSLA